MEIIGLSHLILLFCGMIITILGKIIWTFFSTPKQCKDHQCMEKSITEIISDIASMKASIAGDVSEIKNDIRWIITFIEKNISKVK